MIKKVYYNIGNINQGITYIACFNENKNNIYHNSNGAAQISYFEYSENVESISYMINNIFKNKVAYIKYDCNRKIIDKQYCYNNNFLNNVKTDKQYYKYIKLMNIL